MYGVRAVLLSSLAAAVPERLCAALPLVELQILAGGQQDWNRAAVRPSHFPPSSPAVIFCNFFLGRLSYPL